MLIYGILVGTHFRNLDLCKVKLQIKQILGSNFYFTLNVTIKHCIVYQVFWYQCGPKNIIHTGH